MKAWEIYTWNFPGAGPHPAVIISHPDRVKHKPQVNVLLCSSQRANRIAQANEVMLDAADGLDWETLVKCDLIYAVDKTQLSPKRGEVIKERRRQIAERIVKCLALAEI